MRIGSAISFIVISSFIAILPGRAADEGMYPISEIGKLNLRSQGLAIPVEEIFSADQPSLIYAIVSVGATGSLVSPDGLFITNHHVAFSAVQAASTTEHDYLTHGFLAKTRTDEVQAKGMTARITESFRDVSVDILSAVKPVLSLAERTKAIEKRIKEIVAQTEAGHPGKRAEVAEMFLGRTYVLFVYTYLKDIRLVYIPPRSIGEFGGDIDNWMWPRHTGDFSFLRAYTAPDGSPADFSPRNVPFRPRRFLKVDPAGLQEGDFMFLLGYPGRTYRHFTSSYLAYEQDFRMPYTADWYDWQIALMEKAGAQDAGVALKLAARIKGLANTTKNLRGKLKGMKKMGLVEKKSEEEKALQNYIESDPSLRRQYGDVLAGINKIYTDLRGGAECEMILDYLRSSVQLFQFAWTAYESAIELQKPDLERESAYMERNWAQTRQRLFLTQKNYYALTDQAVLRELFLRALRLKGIHRIRALDDLFPGDVSETNVEAFIAKAYRESKLQEEKSLADLLGKSPQEISARPDPFLRLAAALYPAYRELQEQQKARKGAQDTLFARLVDVKEKFLGRNFIPDANSTLRLTFGHIKGYEPADAVYCKPFTTLAGVLEKTTGAAPFQTPRPLFDLWKTRNFGRFEHPGLKDVPVCMLYDADTTGGNSGSPVLNARGELVGVNFDRTFEATINDYAWSAGYSRSIAVDIRYVLWLAQKFSGAGYLLEEMGVR